jgi:hypothetical protein
MTDDNRPSWKPFTTYILKWGERRRTEGHEAPDIAPAEYWQRRRELEEMKQQPRTEQRQKLRK